MNIDIVINSLTDHGYLDWRRAMYSPLVIPTIIGLTEIFFFSLTTKRGRALRTGLNVPDDGSYSVTRKIALRDSPAVCIIILYNDDNSKN